MPFARLPAPAVPCLPLLAALLIPGGAANAQVFDGTVFAGAALMTSDLTEEFSINTGSAVETAVQSHDNALAVGAHLGVRWSALSLEGTVAVIPTDLVTDLSQSADVTEDQRILILGASALYNFPGRFFEFFLAAGAGIKSYSADDPAGGFEAGSDVMFNAGGGARIFLTESLALRADVRDYISTFDAFEADPDSDQPTQTQHDVLLTIGLSYRGGG